MATHEHDALVIGAGFAGLYQLHCLRDQLGLDVAVLEAGRGRRRHLVLEPLPRRAVRFREPLLQFLLLEGVVRRVGVDRALSGAGGNPALPQPRPTDRLDLRRNIQFGTRVVAARFDEAANRWNVTTKTGEVWSARFLITAVGCLSTANVPAIPGLEHFGGEWHHTGEWPQEGVDFTGKRVGLIGTGSTGIQTMPVIAAAAEHLTVFQRTPTYSVPARNAPLTDDFKRWVKANYDEIRRITHANTSGHGYFIEDRSVWDVSPEEREALYESRMGQRWATIPCDVPRPGIGQGGQRHRG